MRPEPPRPETGPPDAASAPGAGWSASGDNEFANVLRKKFRLDWPLVAETVADVREMFKPIRPVDIATHDAALAVAGAHGFSFHDALIVALALNAGCDTLLTEDLQAGRRIDGLVIVNPFAPGQWASSSGRSLF